ncbi:MAG: cytochrome P450 [Hyphomicrobium sp.]|nr:cytochrome P450 [Hyphomicrobium sp.]
MYEPPHPRPLPPILSLARVMLQGDGDLLSLLPASAYRVDAGWLGYSRRSILIVNAPELTARIMSDEGDLFPKNDLMVGAVEPLIGDSIFVSSGDTWRRQRRMIDPAFSHIHLARAFNFMAAAVEDYEAVLDRRATSGESFSLDLAMSELTADVITRTVFSTALASSTARDVFESFAIFEKSLAHIELARLIFGKPFEAVPQRQEVLDACRTIRRHLGELVDTHLGPSAMPYHDIASSVIGARDTDTGKPLSREEVIDQLGVFFLAGHETTASVLTWAFYILATVPEVRERMRREVDAVAGEGPITIEHTKRMTYIRNVFRETLRLYPPITFLPRVTRHATTLGRFRLRRGAMIMVSPWVIHRHHAHWRNPHAFDPDRFLPERETDLKPGTYMPFGQGPRICVGAAFATTESILILARLVRRFDFEIEQPDRVRPVAHLTTSPAEEIKCLVRPTRRSLARAS